MRILSVKQPWPWALVDGWKDVENRSWRTAYRGPIAIHASRTPAWRGWDELDRLGAPHPFADELSWGAVVGVVDLVDITERADSPWAHSGAWHWIVESPRWLSIPLPRRGQVGLVRTPNDVIAHVDHTVRGP